MFKHNKGIPMIRFYTPSFFYPTLIILTLQACSSPFPKDAFPISVGEHNMAISPHPDSISAGYLHLRVLFDENPTSISVNLISTDEPAQSLPMLSTAFQDSIHIHAILEPETSYSLKLGQQGQKGIEIQTGASNFIQTKNMDGILYKAAIEQNFEPIYGIHPIRFLLLYQLQSEEAKPEWKPLQNAHLSMMPWMGMSSGKGHGSSFNEQPEPTSIDGVYEGKASFTMPGKWDIRLKTVSPLSPDTLTFVFPLDVKG